MWVLVAELPIEWTTNGDEFGAGLVQAMADIYPSSSHFHSMMPADDIIPVGHFSFGFQGDDAPLRTGLRITPTDPVTALAVGDGEIPRAEIDAWRACVDKALAAVVEQQAFRWQALIGGGPTYGQGGTALMASATLGPLRLTPTGRRVVRHTPRRSDWHSGSLDWLEPVYVTGSMKAAGWERVIRGASTDLHLLCCVLSVVWGQHWTLLTGPHRMSSADPNLPIPDVVPNGAPDSELVREIEIDEDTGLELPDWLDGELINGVRDDVDVRSALAAHFEGLEILHEHPSLALLAFVAAIETIGGWHFGPLPRCEVCRVIRGSTGRFRETVRLVAAEAESKTLSDVYDRRSRTAHDARLHGTEELFHAMTFPWLESETPNAFFSYSTVGAMRDVSRGLLFDVLTGRLSRFVPG